MTLPALLVAVALLLPGALQEALEQYDFGEFEAACARLDGLQAAKDFDVEARLKTLKYLGACRHALRDDPKADEAWTALLAMDGTARLDPVQFPPDMVAFFEGVRDRFEARQAEDAAAMARAARDAAARDAAARDAAARDAAARDAAAHATPPPARAPSTRKSRARALLPFGVGQFQNGHDAKGTTLAVLDGAALAIGLGGLIAFEMEKESGTLLGGGTFRDPGKADTLQAVYLTGFASFGALWLYGIADGLVNFQDTAAVSILPTPDGFVVGGTF